MQKTSDSLMILENLQLLRTSLGGPSKKARKSTGARMSFWPRQLPGRHVIEVVE